MVWLPFACLLPAELVQVTPLSHLHRLSNLLTSGVSRTSQMTLAQRVPLVWAPIAPALNVALLHGACFPQEILEDGNGLATTCPNFPLLSAPFDLSCSCLVYNRCEQLGPPGSPLG